eukprot:233447-Pyramimonas_sp.AAC.1
MSGAYAAISLIGSRSGGRSQRISEGRNSKAGLSGPMRLFRKRCGASAPRATRTLIGGVNG